jgi:AcrR family transcriptional regulator
MRTVRRSTVESGRWAAGAASSRAGRAHAARRPGRRPAAEAGRTRERILRQAQRLFARKGYGATSLRELAAAAGVRLFTIQHHFGSKQRLYAELVGRWDREVEAVLSPVLAEPAQGQHLVARVVDTLFDFFLANRARVAINARAGLGEGVPRRLVLTDRSWVRFVNANLEGHQLNVSGLDIALLLITIEGMLHNHVLAAPHYRHLCGRDVTDAAVAGRVKRHLTEVIVRLLGGTAMPASGGAMIVRRSGVGARRRSSSGSPVKHR